MTTDATRDSKMIDQTERNLNSKLASRNEMVKRDRLAFMQDWNEMRKKNEEYIIKQSAEKEDKPQVKEDTTSNLNNAIPNNILDGKTSQEFEDTQKIERDLTINNLSNLSNKKKPKTERVHNDSESDVSRNEGIDMEVLWTMKRELIAKIDTVDTKLNNLNVYTERIFGGMTEEIIKIESSGGKNNNDVQSYGLLGSRIEDVNQFINRLMQNNNDINTTNN